MKLALLHDLAVRKNAPAHLVLREIPEIESVEDIVFS